MRKLLLLAALCCFSALAADTRHFELRIYENTRGKAEGTLERFRNDIARLFEKHGLEPLGFWTGENDANVMIYLLAAPSKAAFEESTKKFGEDPEFKAAYAASTQKHGNTVKRIESYGLTATEWSPVIKAEAKEPARAFELRIYNVKPGRMEAYLENYREHRLELFEKHGLENFGFWTVNDQDKFVMLVAAKSPEAIRKAKEGYHNDPEWQRATKPLQADGGPTGETTTWVLKPTDFSKTK